MMSSRLLPTSAFVLLAAMPAFLNAQETSAKEDERLSQLTRNDGALWYTPKTRVSVGLRILTSGAQIDFGGLGSVPFVNDLVSATDTSTRTYQDGTVVADALRADEKDSTTGAQTSTPGGRYLVYGTDANGNPALTGNYLAYTPGQTRSWEVYSQAQFLEKPGYVAYHNYAAVSEGAASTKKQGATGGLELNYTREIGQGTRYLKWGVAAGVTLNDINGKTAGTVVSSLRVYTDYYSLNGATIPLSQLENPSYNQDVDSDNDGYYEFTENTVPISQTQDPSLTTDVITPGGATVTGRWQVKGAYFMFKVGPTLRTQITDTIGVSASIGLAGAYAGTRYTAYESFQVAAMPETTIETVDKETGETTRSGTETKFLSGYYADLNLDWDVNDRFGLFGGVTAQQLDSYEQKLDDRTAKIDLGSAVGVRGGVTVRF